LGKSQQPGTEIDVKEHEPPTGKPQREIRQFHVRFLFSNFQNRVIKKSAAACDLCRLRYWSWRAGNVMALTYAIVLVPDTFCCNPIPPASGQRRNAIKFLAVDCFCENVYVPFF
jgi:hypothetical protein